MGSAVGVITGCDATVFNPAGLHINTVAPHKKNVTTDASSVSAFVVDGEIVNSSQDVANIVGTRLILYSAKSPQPFLSPVRIATLVVGVKSLAVPSHVGLRRNLPSHIGLRSPNILSRHSMVTVLVSIEQEKQKDKMTLRQSLQQYPRAIHGSCNVG